MTAARKTALALMIVLGAFACAMLGALTDAYVRERRSGILAENEVQRLKREQFARPDDAVLKERIRDLDERARAEHFANRRRFLWAGYILLATAAAWVLSAQRFFARPSPRTAPPRRAKPTDGRRGARVVAVCAGVLSLALLYMGVFMRPVLPPKDLAPGRAGVPPAGEPAPAARVEAESWPCFRGPGNLGVAADGDWPTTWSVASGQNILWRTPIPAEGKSSPIVWSDRVFLTGATKTELRVVCFDRATGAVRWNSTVADVDLRAREFKVFEETGYAAPTPATDGARVYAVFAAGIVAAFDFEGNQVWVKDLGAPESAYGFASSPIYSRAAGVVVVQFDQGANAEERKSQLLALSPETGDIVWRIPRPVPNSWSTPALIPAPGGEQLVACGAPWVIAYDLANRRELWRVKGLDGDVAASPAFGAGLVFVTSDAAELLAIRPDGSGNVTESHVAWRSDQGMPDIASPVSNGARVFQSAAGGYLTCFDAATGRLVWEHMLETSAQSSPIVVGGLVYLTQLGGATRIFDMNAPQYAELGRGEIGEPVYATPAFVDSRIYVRGTKSLVCVGPRLRPREESR